MLFLGVLGTIVGGRLGYVLFYQPQAYMNDPLKFLRVWEGGMSFHGGLLGVVASQWWFAISRGKPVWQVMDSVAPCVPLGLAAGRLGNFINGQLWGRAAPASLPWALVFPQSGSTIPRHPSQLYRICSTVCSFSRSSGRTRARSAGRGGLRRRSWWGTAHSAS